MNKISIIIALLAIAFSNTVVAQQETEQYEKLEINMYPAAKAGYKQVYFQVPISAHEEDLKLEFYVGINKLVDCNNYFLLGSIKEETVEGWGYNYYSVLSKGESAGTLMGCVDAKKTEKFIHLQPELIRYNSKLPIVLYVPDNMEVKYRIWRADKKMMEVAVKNKANAAEKKMIISAETRPCQAGVMLKDCMQVKSSKDQKEWYNFYDDIKGFDYKKAYEYEIVVNEEEVKNPPADASSVKYTLVKIISQKKSSGTKNTTIEDKRWRLIELNGKAIKGTADSHYLIFHTKDTKIEAKANCNVMHFGYQLKNETQLIVKPGISTKMACPDTIEQDFITALTGADNVTADGMYLSINKGKMAPLARFELVK
jgi:ecotin